MTFPSCLDILVILLYYGRRVQDKIEERNRYE